MNQDLAAAGIELDQTEAIKCEKCEGEIFQQGLMLRKVSRFLTGTAKDGLVPIQTFYCIKCNHINNEFLPEELKSK